MAHKYDSIRELDREARRNGGQGLYMLPIADYMIPPSFKEIFAPVKMEHIRNIMVTPEKLANSSNRIRVKNVYTNVSFEFSKMINAARFLGATGNNMRYGILDEVARVYRVDEEEYVFVYDDKERPMERSSGCPSLNGLVEVVSSTGERTPFFSYLLVAKHLGLLIGHVMEEEKRARNGELAKRYVTGKEVYTIEFGGKRRNMNQSHGIRCHWKGIYDKDGDWEKIHRIKVTR